MKQALIGVVLFAAGAAAGAWVTGSRAGDPAPAADAGKTESGAPVQRAADAPQRYALQAWEGCRPLQAGDAFTGPVTRTLTLSDGRSVQVSLVPVTRDNGARVFDALVASGGGSARSQIGFESPLLAEGVLMRAVDLDGVQREVGGGADYIHRPHPMAR